MPTYQPLGDRVVVKRVERQATTPGGIVIPDTARHPDRGVAMRATVVAVSDTRRGADRFGCDIPVKVRGGETVLIGEYAGTEVEDGVLVLDEDDILAVVKE